MRRSLLASIAVAICMASASVVSAVASAGIAIAETVRRGWGNAIERVPIPSPTAETEPSVLPVVEMVRARSFHLRQIKRETPCVMPEWRMCPSV
ncbi:hypothetical protein [Ottowia sp. VDI28]|uniref:hypothetical protein n=1 Tax=Ottowia sp. VDI28 TaxID=3133968 RepID=UPI003C30D61B